MRTDLGHLPANKQREPDCVVQIFFEEFENAHGNPYKQTTQRQKILLSYHRSKCATIKHFHSL